MAAAQQPATGNPPTGAFDPLAILAQIEQNYEAALSAINTVGADTVDACADGCEKAAAALRQTGEFLRHLGGGQQPVQPPAPQPQPVDPGTPDANPPAGAFPRPGDALDPTNPNPQPQAQPQRIRPNPAMFGAANNPAVAACCDRLDRLKERCRHKAHPAVAATVGAAPTGPLTDAVLAQLISVGIDLITRWLRQRFPTV